MINNDVIEVVVVGIILIVLCVGLVVISIRVRKGGGSMTTIAMGATDEFLSKDQAKSVEVIVEQNAGKTIELPSSSQVKNQDKSH